MYCIIKSHRSPESSEFATDHVIGPFATYWQAEHYNNRYPSPEYNRIVRFHPPLDGEE